MSRTTTSGATRLSRAEAGLVLLAAVALAVQLSGLSWIRPDAPARSIAPIVVGSGSASPEAKLGVLWRDFRPGQYLVGSPSGLICGAALHRGTGVASLIMRFCTDVPTTPGRRFGLGYDSIVIEASLPDGSRLAYSLLDFVDTGSDRGREFSQGPTRENSISVQNVFVRDATDVIVVFGTDLPADLLVVGVRGSLNGRAFAETDAFEPLGPASDMVPLELAHSLKAPVWATEAP
jgi:hypothetical protein